MNRFGRRSARRLLDLGERSARPSEADIGADGVVEQQDLLRDHGDRGPERGQGQRTHVLPVDRDRAAR